MTKCLLRPKWNRVDYDKIEKLLRMDEKCRVIFPLVAPRFYFTYPTLESRTHTKDMLDFTPVYINTPAVLGTMLPSLQSRS